MSEEFYGLNLFGEKVDVDLAKEEEYEEVVSKENDFNIFALTDAIGARDKRSAWTIYEKALASGLTADEIFWRVMWGVKALLLSVKTNSAEEAGLNPFVFKKMKSFLNNWKVDELEKLSKTLVVGYHDARRGIGEMETMIEKTILKL